MLQFKHQLSNTYWMMLNFSYVLLCNSRGMYITFPMKWILSKGYNFIFPVKKIQVDFLSMCYIFAGLKKWSMTFFLDSLENLWDSPFVLLWVKCYMFHHVIVNLFFFLREELISFLFVYYRNDVQENIERVRILSDSSFQYFLLLQWFN